MTGSAGTSFSLIDAKTKGEFAAVREPLATCLDTHEQAEEQVFDTALSKKSPGEK